MLKKFALGTGLLVGLITAGGCAIWGIDKFFGYAEVLWKDTRAGAEAAIPPSVELERLHHEVAKLDRDIESKQSELAEAIVATEITQREVNDLTAGVEGRRKTLVARAKEIKEAKDFVKIDGEMVHVTKAKAQLDSEFKRWEQNNRQLENLNRTLGIQIANQDMLRQHLDTLVSQQREMRSAVDELDSLLKQLELEQMQSRYQNDNSRLSHIKTDIQKLRQRVEVQRQKLKLTEEYAPGTDGASVDEMLEKLGERDEATID